MYVKPAKGEKHLRNIRQLTSGGENAEAYFSSDGKRLIFQSKHGKMAADQIFTMNTDGSNKRLVSTGKGRCTCSYFFPDGKHILFSSTHADSPEAPPVPDFSQGYVWPIYPSYTLYKARADGTQLKTLTTDPHYNAEATISPNGKKIVFTSTRHGDLDLYVMDANGKNVKRLTREVGYDGGAFFSPDNKKICFRAYYPKTAGEIADYKALLRQNLIRPSTLDLYVMNADGTGKRRITNNRAANFCPFFTPDGKKVIFASNMHDSRGRDFELYLIGVDGKGLERLTFSPEFDGFPMFSPDGKKLVWCSNRNSATRGDTNVFIAEWVK